MAGGLAACRERRGLCSADSPSHRLARPQPEHPSCDAAPAGSWASAPCRVISKGDCTLAMLEQRNRVLRLFRMYSSNTSYSFTLRVALHLPCIHLTPLERADPNAPRSRKGRACGWPGSWDPREENCLSARVLHGCAGAGGAAMC